MHTSSPTRLSHRPGLPFILFCAFLATLWIGGGASRGDVSGQVVVRLAAAISLVLLILFGDRPAFARARPIWLLLIAAACLAAAQLMPLPPAVWQSLPGRAFLAEATLGHPQPWRPWTVVPGATMNALASLIIPLATLFMMTSIHEDDYVLVPGVILVMIVSSNILGLMQLSGAYFGNPLINGTPGEMSGPFANRNHFALLLAIGCLLLPVWAFPHRQASRGRPIIGLGVGMLFLLTILASGSRAGMALGILAFCGSIFIARNGIRRELSGAPAWAFPALIASVVLLVAIFVLISVAADRAVSIQRIFDMDAGQDMRGRALPTVWTMLREYFPVGAGLGSFDPIFRIHEPLTLLKPTYFNHAHNDLLEVVLDAGLPGVLMVTAAIGWWGWASLGAWRGRAGTRAILSRAGSAILLLIVLASAFDYPARTPTVMALIVVAALWLHGYGPAREA